MKVVLDPGHGQNYNSGAVKGYYEGNQMFKLAQFLKDELEKYNIIDVIITRKKLSDDPSLATRGAMAKGYGLFISLHSNAPPLDAKNYSSIKGTSIYDSVTRPNTALADKLGISISKLMGHNYRGTNYRRGNNGDYYGVLRSAILAGCPSAILIEHGFHTNHDDCAFLMSDANLKKLAEAEAIVIAEHYNLKQEGDSMSNQYIRAIQAALRDHGVDGGPVDGIAGEKTMQGVREAVNRMTAAERKLNQAGDDKRLIQAKEYAQKILEV